VVVERSERYAPQELYRELFYGLEQHFRAYHNQQFVREYTPEQIARMTGVEFENYLMRVLKECGCTVSGTPKTGDKGADIIARLPPGRTIIIQAKRSGAPVGNRAVQEVAAALAYYRGTEAWVVSNSSFTAAARELAQSNRVRLIGGADLRLVAQFIGQPI
jgi:restriction system protein